MLNTPHIARLISRAAVAVLIMAPALGAQETRLFTWRGTVDDDVRISMRAGSVQSRIVSGDPNASYGRVARSNVLPRREGMVRVELIEGRGTVRVLQQPAPENNYTTVIQVKDAQGGAAPYRFQTWFDAATTVSRRGRGRGRIVESVAGGDVDLAAGTPVLRWRGNIDGDVQITIRGARVGHSVIAGDAPRNVSTGVMSGGLPARALRLSLSPRQGRGNIVIVQQPTAENGYTAILRVNDGERGFGYYDFDVVVR